MIIEILRFIHPDNVAFQGEAFGIKIEIETTKFFAQMLCPYIKNEIPR